MPRTPRYSLADQPHHVIQRGNNRTTIFKCESDFTRFADCLSSAIRRFGCQLHAYVFMTNHVHLLMTPGDTKAIGFAMRSMGRQYVGYFNAKYRRTGTLYEGRYRSTVVDSCRYLFTCFRYIEENPVRAGLVVDPASYRWSSYRANALGGNDSLLTPHSQFVALGRTSAERQAAYRTLFRVELDQADVSSIRYSTHFGKRLSSAGRTDSGPVSGPVSVPGRG